MMGSLKAVPAQKLSLQGLIAEHEISVEWNPKIVWVHSRKYPINPVGVKRCGEFQDNSIGAMREAVNELVSRINSLGERHATV